VRHRFTWDQVESVIAFKTDLYSYDEIWIAILGDAREVLACVPESSGSFSGFIRDLPKWLNGCRQPAEWWDGVAHPAFERNETLIYQRPSVG
jgi:hypothetical protein